MDNIPPMPCSAVQVAAERLKAAFDFYPWEDERMIAAAIDHMTSALITGFTAYFDPAEVAERFLIPAEYLCFVQWCKGGWERGQPYGLYLHDTEGVVSNTLYLCEVMAEMRPPSAGMWIEVGHSSDKHDFFLCCDPALPLYGYVIEGDDDHPWIPDGEINQWIKQGYLRPDGSHIHASFLHFLQSIRA